MWLNITVHAHSDLFTTIRQLEFTLLLLTQQLDEVFNAVQCTLQGSLPTLLINPTVLLSILKNASLKLSGGYELVVGIRPENIHLYYDIVKISRIATPHSIKLMMNLPLKTADQHFTLFKITTLPERISSEKFVQYLVHYVYFGLHYNQRDYLLFTEAQYNCCAKNSLTDNVIYNAQTLTCESSPFFQNADNFRLCQRNLLLRHQAPFLSDKEHIGLTSFQNDASLPYAVRDKKNPDISHDITPWSRCNTQRLRLLHFFYRIPNTAGITSLDTHKTGDTLCLPSNVYVITDDAAHKLANALPADTKQLDSIAS
jgi:hypothetical protein